jgi:methylenetetrahydrofolate dehydrogenase (NADP+) / methenyltetrahydrofolate cyclohydrolase
MSPSKPQAMLIDGKAIAQEITESLVHQVTQLKEKNITPGLAVVLVGEDPASQVYVRNKGKMAEKIGLHSVQHSLPAATSEADILARIEALNEDPSIHGILVQLPLPDHIDSAKVLRLIRPEKDVDGFHPVNVGLLATGLNDQALVPCTPAGCVTLAKHHRGDDLSGLEAVIIGRSNIVGKPVAQLLLQENCTTTIVHSRTKNLEQHIGRADILVACLGRAQFVKGDWIKQGATVIDVGINRIDAPEKGPGKTRLVGDVDFDSALPIAGAITPVPGGVGPMTIAMLMQNVVTAAQRLSKQ